jgi:hypothetical protein
LGGCGHRNEEQHQGEQATADADIDTPLALKPLHKLFSYSVLDIVELKRGWDLFAHSWPGLFGNLRDGLSLLIALPELS